jgi:hypothetical protein
VVGAYPLAPRKPKYRLWQVRLQSRNPRATVVGVVGSAASIVWRIYSAVTTAEQVPKDLKAVSGLLADPGFWPWVFMILFLALLAWSFWYKPEESPLDRATVSTSGCQSPSFGHVARDAHIHYHSSSSPEEPQTSDYNFEAATLHGLQRIMTDGPATINQSHTGSGHNIGELRVGVQPFVLTDQIISDVAQQMLARFGTEQEFVVEGAAPHSWEMAEQLKQGFAGRGLKVRSDILQMIQDFGPPRRAPIMFGQQPDGTVLVSLDRMATL